MTPQPQEVWADNDKRSAGRTLRVDQVDVRYAHCSVLTVSGGRSAETNGKFPKTRILLARFTGNSTGYSLVEAVAQPEAETTAVEITQPDGVTEPSEARHG